MMGWDVVNSRIFSGPGENPNSQFTNHFAHVLDLAYSKLDFVTVEFDTALSCSSQDLAWY